MGEFLFSYPKRRVVDAFARHAFMAGRGRRPLATSTRIERGDDARNLLVLETPETKTESASLYFPFVDQIEVGKFFFASSEPLPSRSDPKPLFLELCRGQLSRMLRYFWDWKLRGLPIPNALQRVVLRDSVHRFALIAAGDRDAPDYDDACYETFVEFVKTSAALNDLFLNKSLELRRDAAGSRPTRFGFASNVARNWTRPYDENFVKKRGMPWRRRSSETTIFESYNPRFSWNEIEYEPRAFNWKETQLSLRHATALGLKTTVGPLIRWDADIPRRFYRNDSSIDDLRVDFMRYVRSAIENLSQGHFDVANWIVASNLERETPGTTLEFRVELAKKAAYFARVANPSARVFLGFEQAFGDAERFGVATTSSALDLARRVRHLGFDGFYLETNFGLAPGSSAPRDPMELHRFFDSWASFGKPLVLGMSFPSASPVTPGDEKTVDQYADERPFAYDEASSQPTESLCWNEPFQYESALLYIKSALARRAVEEIVWTQFADDIPYAYEEYVETSRRARKRYLRTQMGRDVESAIVEQPKNGDGDEIYASVVDEEEGLDDLVIDDSQSSVPNSGSISLEVDDDSFLSSSVFRYPSSGLFTLKDKPKSTYRKIESLRESFLR